MTEVAEAERIYQALARDGRVLMPLEKTFWAERFGVSRLINCEKAGNEAPGQD